MIKTEFIKLVQEHYNNKMILENATQYSKRVRRINAIKYTLYMFVLLVCIVLAGMIDTI